MEKRFGLMLEALDDLKTNEVYVSTGSSPVNPLWGELMSIRARKLGAAGAVLNGSLRKTNEPALSGAPGPRSLGCKVVDFRIVVEIGSVRVRPTLLCRNIRKASAAVVGGPQRTAICTIVAGQ